MINAIASKSQEIKKLVLTISHNAKVGHIGSALSIADIIAVLYFDVLRVFPNNPKNPKRDRFILSKGHAAAALYSALYLKGFFSKKVLNSYCRNGGTLGEHPQHTVAGVELSTGSLGHGLPVGCGFALAAKLGRKHYQTFVLISDAECGEGEVWESALFAAQQKLDNLTVIIDYNKVQALGRTTEVLGLEPMSDKWRSFGWTVNEVDGHDIKRIKDQLAKRKKDKPNVVIAHTIRGKGVSFMEHKLKWHYLTTTKDQHRLAMEEINKK